MQSIMIFLVLLLLMLQSSLQLTASPSSSQDRLPIAKPGCQDHCGAVKIPYPFGIGFKCFYNESYEIICNTSFHPPKPFLPVHDLRFEVMKIDWGGNPTSISPSEHVQTLVVKNDFHNICRSDNGGVTDSAVVQRVDLRGTPFLFSIQFNVFVAKGCGTSLVLKNSSNEVVTGCASVCRNNISKNMTSWIGVGCCQSRLSSTLDNSYTIYDEIQGLDYYEIDMNHEALLNPQTCNVAAGLLYKDEVPEFSGNFSNLTTVMEWSRPFTAEGSTCGDDGVLTCPCDDEHGYVGNPYLGCQLVKECQICKHGCITDITTRLLVCKKHPLFNLASILGFSVSIGLVMLLLLCYWLYRLVKRIREVRLKAKFFKRNGGLLLQQQISSRNGIVDKTRIFGFCELEKATNNFSEDRILGQGGQGTVYKGMLEDGRIVAIKKSKKVDKSQLEQFINEMVILSQVNHRSVVKILGCCLETEVPLLVYEFIPNGTLYQHIHEPSEDFHVTWRMRLQIALESANALSYLHSSSSAPIYHRDVKSSNILLDERYRAKVSDFGASRAITIEETHVTTCVQGTYGYLDPEYFQSNQFTEKSDVYSFGVVLVELITGKKPIYPNKSGGYISLATEFLFHMENSCLSDMLDTSISEEAFEEELTAVANLAKQCLNMNGKQRPTMKEVAVLLDGIRSPHVSKPKTPECLKSDCMFMEYNSPFSRGTFFSDSSPRTSFSIEALPLINGD
ncbi:wall-associated receptor kinase-like 8 [Chenopodium quinoa]|uniref:Protein kinase domain-containing protein n=1 Tax=Chenopodium quinoa TaxID=63459 RepID=A0A803L4B8_CHEQI|nr:wall-associated receptor kinase-like 8 [Chenopodium quinoa]